MGKGDINEKKNKFKENRFVILIASIVALLLGVDGVIRLMNIQELYNILMGVSLAVTGFIGGFLGLKQYWLIKKEGRNDKFY